MYDDPDDICDTDLEDCIDFIIDFIIEIKTRKIKEDKNITKLLNDAIKLINENELEITKRNIDIQIGCFGVFQCEYKEHFALGDIIDRKYVFGFLKEIKKYKRFHHSENDIKYYVEDEMYLSNFGDYYDAFIPLKIMK